MNSISGSIILTCLIACSACGAPASESDAAPSDLSYGLHYTLRPDPDSGVMVVSLKLSQNRGQLRAMTFSSNGIDAADLAGDGELSHSEQQIVWRPARKGGQLSWRIPVSHRRNGDGHDALLSGEWGIFRAEDVIPRAHTRTLKGATSTTTFAFELPSGWSAISEYSGINKTIAIDNANRRFDQPSGWIAVGKLGVRRETIAGIRVAVAAPEGQSARRMDMLALLNWTLPELGEVIPNLPERLTIISAGDPMWRGGLSAPASLFIHADRPLISENATSTLLHEVTHVALRIRTKPEYDWIGEGLAEYYSLQLLQRGQAISSRRYQAALADQSDWSKRASTLCGATSSGASTALAVVIFRQLDAEIRTATSGQFSLDDVTAKLTAVDSSVGLDSLDEAVTAVLGNRSDALHIDNLPGCRRMPGTPDV